MFWKKTINKNNQQSTKRVYLDWAAATPLLPAAKKAMEPYLGEMFGNPSAIHAEGLAARTAVEAARAQVAKAVQVRPEFVTFTGGGTEGNNLAMIGTIEMKRASGIAYEDMEIITTKIEHPSVSDTCIALERRGVQIKYVQVKETGVIDLEHLRELVTEKTVLFSTAFINSEIGTVQPVRAIKKILVGDHKERAGLIVFHLDAAQAPLWVNCQFDGTGADLLVLDAAKCCGPKGVGVLISGRQINIMPATSGGGQERGLRPGTENVAGIVGAAVAIADAQSKWQERSDTVSEVRNQAMTYIQNELPIVMINGALSSPRVPNNINISIPGLDTEFAAVVLDKHGFAVSTKSACSGAGGGASTVVLETTGDPARASSTLRITLGPDTTLEQLKSLTGVLKQHIEQMSLY